MVCDRCKMVVKSELKKLNLHPLSVELGLVELAGEVSETDMKKLDETFHQLGFAFIDDKNGQLIERIKNLVIELVHHNEQTLKTNLSDYLVSNLNQDYKYISTLFSEVEGTTIEKYYIAQRIEKVKELLVYDELSLSEIAHKLNYSSAAYLSNQFKKVTGFTPGQFKTLGGNKRLPLDEV